LRRLAGRPPGRRDAARDAERGVFEGTADEVNFEALGQRSSLDAMRDMVVGEETMLPVTDPRQALLQAAGQMLEALAEMVANDTLAVVQGLAGAKARGPEANKEK